MTEQIPLLIGLEAVLGFPPLAPAFDSRALFKNKAQVRTRRFVFRIREDAIKAGHSHN